MELARVISWICLMVGPVVNLALEGAGVSVLSFFMVVILFNILFLDARI